MSFKDMILKNLQNNGYPAKKVSFPLEKMYEMADSKGENLNDVLKDLEESMNVATEKTLDKIIFKAVLPENKEDMMAQAKDMMDKMSAQEIKDMQDQVENMSVEDKEKMMEQAKKMGLI